MPEFGERSTATEMMDDPGAARPQLEAALRELPRINHWLGGYRATIRTLESFRRAEQPRSLRILDVGTGAGDYPVSMLRWGLRRGIDIEITGLDLSRDAVTFARSRVNGSLPQAEASRIRFIVGDALDLDNRIGTFDICTSALFFHHLSDDDCALVMARMAEVADRGIIVNDIHRHPLAYHGIRIVTRSLPFSDMVRHDGPLSVLRSFTRSDLLKLARRAGIPAPRLEWHPAFRWILTNLPH